MQDFPADESGHDHFFDTFGKSHAGELTPGLVKPEDLTFHIREAVLVAGAERIGHGVDLVHEDDWKRLARTMARRGVAVEVTFSSNKQILGVAGDDHPFNAYRSPASRWSWPPTTPASHACLHREELGCSELMVTVVLTIHALGVIAALASPVRASRRWWASEP